MVTYHSYRIKIIQSYLFHSQLQFQIHTSLPITSLEPLETYLDQTTNQTTIEQQPVNPPNRHTVELLQIRRKWTFLRSTKYLNLVSIQYVLPTMIQLIDNHINNLCSAFGNHLYWSNRSQLSMSATIPSRFHRMFGSCLCHFTSQFCLS